MTAFPSVANDNSVIQLPCLTAGEMASVISCVLSAKARMKDEDADPDLNSAQKKLITAFMEQAQ